MRTFVTVCALLVLAACSDSEGSEGVDACSSIYFEGAAVTEDVWAGECINDDGAHWVYGPMRIECTDGTELGWNELAWWDSEVHVHADASSRIAPDSAQAECDA